MYEGGIQLVLFGLTKGPSGSISRRVSPKKSKYFGSQGGKGGLCVQKIDPDRHLVYINGSFFNTTVSQHHTLLFLEI